ncbi:MAG TPA: hypothetical protein V6D28_31010 [Leptolyngbyaceae cyanobacterium]
MANHHDFEPSTDTRLAATTRIWSFATGMLALSILFSPTRENIAVPISIATSAAAGTAVVWLADRKSSISLQEHQLKRIENRLNEIEKRVGEEDLEMWLQTTDIASRN